jgi:tetratricopeptide (TPR) repeat protein
VAVVQFLRENSKLVEAERLLQPLLEDEKWSKRAGLWRLASSLAEGRDLPAREMECLERALDAEFRDRPEVMQLERIDKEYGRLLSHYQTLAEAMVTLKVTPPPHFLSKVVRTADRWRSLSKNGTNACDTAARILRQLGERELAWDYLTTPVGLQPGSSAPWLGLATTLSRQGDLKLADEAFASAFAAESTNAQILWDRAQNLRQSGNAVEAKKLLRQLAEGSWQPRFQSLQAQARWQLDQR